MAVTVWVPPLLRHHTRGRDEVVVSGASIHDALLALGQEYGGLSAVPEDGSGEIWASLNVFVNGADIRSLQGVRTPVRDGDEISIVPPIAGAR